MLEITNMWPIANWHSTAVNRAERANDVDCLGLIAAVLASFHAVRKFVVGTLARIDPPHCKTQLMHPFRWSPDNVQDDKRLFMDWYRFHKRDPGKEPRTSAGALEIGGPSTVAKSCAAAWVPSSWGRTQIEGSEESSNGILPAPVNMPNRELSESSPDRINRLDWHMTPRDLKESERTEGLEVVNCGGALGFQSSTSSFFVSVAGVQGALAGREATV